MNTYHNITDARSQMNQLSAAGTPFLFLIDYEMQNIIITTDLSPSSKLQFDFNGVTNLGASQQVDRPAEYYFDQYPMSYESYKKGFDLVQSEIHRGNSFLLNLTYLTRVMSNLTLSDIYSMTKARYKVLLGDEFVCYSPEIFVQIKDGRISSNPMKGTIDSIIPDAQQIILEDQKELAEHYTIVDLIRNDLSRVAKQVKVERFRYIDKIETAEKSLLQVSSEIAGQLPDDYTNHIGDILFELLPAGSISGAPKKKTIEVIRSAEGQERGYYTGICGIFDGRDLDTGVMIRYVEQTNGGLQYRSGGGITSMSDCKTEYQEMLDKVYLPIEGIALADKEAKLRPSNA